MQKVNAKLGGINMLVSPGQELRPSQLFSKATIIFGGDVSHASPGSQASSIAALVGNTNRSCTQYVARLSAQANRKEMIDDLKSMAREIMIEYFNANGGASNPESRPERVLFYRDGVSESQFQAVLSDELPCLRQAFQSLGDGSYNPTITYIVAQKRHNTRLFVSNPQDGEGRNKDVPAGTVVDTGRAVSLPFIFSGAGFQMYLTSNPAPLTSDLAHPDSPEGGGISFRGFLFLKDNERVVTAGSAELLAARMKRGTFDFHSAFLTNFLVCMTLHTDICHAQEYDFYLQSHSGIQGTTRPVHYHVLKDENGFTPDAIQNLTFALCHLYCRCTRSVSLVPPVYYAHLAAGRGAQYDMAQVMRGSDTSSVGGSSGGGGAGKDDAPTRRIKLHDNVLNGMFFA